MVAATLPQHFNQPCPEQPHSISPHRKSQSSSTALYLETHKSTAHISLLKATREEYKMGSVGSSASAGMAETFQAADKIPFVLDASKEGCSGRFVGTSLFVFKGQPLYTHTRQGVLTLMVRELHVCPTLTFKMHTHVCTPFADHDKHALRPHNCGCNHCGCNHFKIIVTGWDAVKTSEYNLLDV